MKPSLLDEGFFGPLSNYDHAECDMLRQLLPFAADKTHRSIDQLKIDDLSAERARSFLCGVEIDRGPQDRHSQPARGWDSF